MFSEQSHIEEAKILRPKIIQILIGPNDSQWQGKLLGLGEQWCDVLFRRKRKLDQVSFCD